MRDASAFLGQWPFTSAPAPSAALLRRRYRECGVEEAAVSPMAAVLQPEPMSANLALFDELRDGAGEAGVALRPVPVINPSLSGWEEDLERCLRLAPARLAGVRIVPNYHGFSLEDGVADRLAEACQARQLTLCVQVRMEDERSHHPSMPVPGVGSAQVRDLAVRHEGLPLLVCGAYLRELEAYAACANIVAELSFVESGRLLAAAIAALGAGRLAMGTHAPLHVIEAGVAKVGSDELDAGAEAAIGDGNFRRLFPR
ncbi:MAG TPA: hypothetical protein VIA06_03700 [Candidatus Dormibacteraeota bacterium]|jgi:hypothetical protein|nr:hypothetical protein [Candidatus Dormibacteraeota bacterium]